MTSWRKRIDCVLPFSSWSWGRITRAGKVRLVAIARNSPLQITGSFPFDFLEAKLVETKQLSTTCLWSGWPFAKVWKHCAYDPWVS